MADCKDTGQLQSGQSYGQLRLSKPRTMEDRAISLSKQICSTLYPGSKFDIRVEKQQGGTFNSIIAVRVSRQRNADSPVVKERFVIRYSKDGQDGAGQQTATLKFLRQCSSFLSRVIPRVIACDDDEGNILGRPYLFLQAMPGEKLSHALPNLNLEQKKMVARDLARTLTALDAIRAPVVGQIDFLEPLSDPSVSLYFPGYKVLPIPVSSDMCSMVVYASTTPQAVPVGNGSCLDYLSWRLQSIFDSSQNNRISAAYTDLLQLAQRLHEKKGFFTEEVFTIFHADLAPRNVLVAPTADGGCKITGIVDWDDAMFVPRIVAASPPDWLWRAGEDSDDEAMWVTETYLEEEPDGTEKDAIRRAFEQQLVSEGFVEFLDMAYDKYSKLARKVAYHALYCFDVEETLDDVADTLSEGSKMDWD